MTYTLVLRLAGPLQSWGGASVSNRRDTRTEPGKSGIVGLLAAAQGRRRTDPIDELIGLRLGVRVDQAGSMLRDYHTLSDYRSVPLLSAQVGKDGRQRLTSPKKFTGVTQRFYLQDAVFVVAISGDAVLLDSLVDAIRHPTFPLALGRRSCVPTQPLLLADGRSALWSGDPLDVLGRVPWQASERSRVDFGRRSSVQLPVSVDASMESPDERTVLVEDVPTSFDPLRRGFTSRRVLHTWVRLATGVEDAPGGLDPFDPFALFGGE